MDLRYLVFQSTGSIPISTVIINEASGSRTILHAYRFVHLSVLCQLLPLSPNSQNRTLLLPEAHVLQYPFPLLG